jgi:hypothetical protein
MASFEGEVADVVKSAYESNKPAVLAAIQAAEGGAQAFIVNAIKNAPKQSGIVGELLPFVEGQLESAVAAQLVKYGPEYVYTFVDGLLTAEAAKLGG